MALTLKDSVAWLDSLERARTVHTTGAWPLVSVLDHLAQSIEMSMDGYPQPKGALFQMTAGRAAFTVFRARGKMSHGLAEPIPGAPPLDVGSDWKPAARRLRAAIARFEAHKAPLKPHFAYGELSKDDYTLAHAMHIANHQEEIVAA
ncbi:DUF1569 domain-containing protein [Ramlibacter sp. PS4R-6]|uniref:DUF1569 domain-containing protein n=1 Tax=Ramlibacter sp. PS4R-6 TaxID=3133438 RepID=UPI0030A5B366